MPDGGHAPAHVVMAVGNDVTTDTRVRRLATSLARVGVRVTVLAYTAEATRRESLLGDVRVIRVPVPWDLRDARRTRMARRRKGRVRVGYRTPADVRQARDRLARRRRRVQQALARTSRPGPGKALLLRLARVLLAVLARVQGARVLVQSRLDAARARAWRTRDSAWGRTTRLVRWRRQLPEIEDYELAFGPVLDELRPDAIHAHDVHMVGIATLASARAHREGRSVPWVYDAHEYVAGLSQYGGRTKRVVAAYLDLEAEHIRKADRVMTVSPQLAEELERRYDLPRRPDLVMNVPVPGAQEASGLSIREVAGVPEGAPLLVYSGGVTSARGVLTAVQALPSLPDAHLAVVAVPHPRTYACAELTRTATELGVADRLHLLEPVAPDQVVAFLRSADAGLIPLLHFGSHEVALTNKLFEYTHAGLPVVVSDCRAQRDFVEQFGVGRVHVAGDPSSLAEAVREVLADPQAFRDARAAAAERLEVYSWEAQERTLWEVYRELLPAGSVADTPGSAPAEDQEREIGRRTAAPVLAVGPSNMAGQGWAWAKAVERAHPEVSTHVLALVNDRFAFPADERVTASEFTRDRSWQARHEQEALSTWTHALLEAGRPILGTQHGTTFAADVPVLRGAGVQVALVFHGSEIRDPARHAAQYAHSPFADADDPLTERLQKQLAVLSPLVASFDGPTFVSTPDLLDDVPGSTWLPVVVDTSVWTSTAPPLQRDVPLLLHVPSNTALKGTRLVEEAMESLVSRGLVAYRRLEGIDPADMPTVLGEADIVLDQFSLGSYGVLACQAMAQGRVTVGHVADVVRERVGQELPIIEATPETLGDVVARVVADRAWACAVASAGPGFVADVHDGRRSAAVLAPWLGVSD